MIAEFVISFREFFEIALVMGAVLAYLKKTGNWKHGWLVYAGAALAAAASIAAAIAFESLAGGFEAHEGQFEAIVSIASAALIGWLAIAMLEGKPFWNPFGKQGEGKLDGRGKAILAFVVFANVFREGVEIVLMLGGVWLSSKMIDVPSVAAGALAAAALAYASFRSIVKLDVKRFLKLTGIILAVFAGWLLLHGLTEVLELAGA
ncbi:MAG: FTR1 family protein [Candidatus Micrarchaeia archaeon]